ncbi:MAG: CocE/NonD family hydrolase [Gammaproteobacteria bacterium]
MTWLRRIALALAVLVLPAGAACAFLLGTPMEVVLPLRSMLTLCALAVLVLAAAAWWLKPAKRLLPAAVGLAGAVLAMAAATAILRAPACEDFTVDSGGTKLAGTACMPADNTPVPVAVFVHGSGPATRSEFRFYAETLARRGIAAVTYDKRGAGRSGGDTYEGGYDLYAQDLAAVSAWAAVQSFARPDTLGLVGFSEAEWVMPLAAPAVDPAYIAVVGASALSPHDQVSEEIEIRLGRAGYDDTAVRAAVAVNDALATIFAVPYLRRTSARCLQRLSGNPGSTSLRTCRTRCIPVRPMPGGQASWRLLQVPGVATPARCSSSRAAPTIAPTPTAP